MKNRKYLQQKFLWKEFLPETTTDFTFMVSKSYIPFTCKFPMVMHFVLILHVCLSSQAMQVKKQIFYEFSYD